VEDLGHVSGTERVIFGARSAGEVADVVDRYLRGRLGASVADVLFRAGRIDAVWGVRTDDGREVVVKAHRAPVDVGARKACVAAQVMLVDAAFPCPAPLSGPDDFEGVVLSAETLLVEGSPGDAREPGTRMAMMTGLAEHIDILRARPDLVSTAGSGPAWCRYHAGPWPTPHDTIFDFTVTPDGFGWLDEFAQSAADRLNVRRPDGEVVVGHADWYGGNLRFDRGRLVGAFDWDLVADTEAVVVGLNAGGYTDTGTSDAATSPDDVAAFLADYDSVRPHAFSAQEQRFAAAAASWVVAYNHRCRLSLLPAEAASSPSLELLHENRRHYLELRW